MSYLSSVIDRVRHPEYTGENRCLPCTIVNVLIAGGLSAGLAWGTTPSVGLSSFALFLGLIYVRGYLVPRTPALTKRYLPDWVLWWFGKQKATTAQAATHDQHSSETERVNPESVLQEVGAIESCRDGTNLCLTDEFTRVWDAQMRTLRSRDLVAHLCQVLNQETDTLTADSTKDGRYILADGGTNVAVWDSEAALLADLAAAQELESRHPEWDNLDVATQGTLLQGLRVFLEECPACGGALDFTQTDVELCCGQTLDYTALRCEACDAVLVNVPSS